MGKAFSLHTFAGHLGGALAPATIIFLVALYDWRTAVMIIGVIGVVCALIIYSQGGILQDEHSAAADEKDNSETEADEKVSTIRLMMSKRMIILLTKPKSIMSSPSSPFWDRQPYLLCLACLNCRKSWSSDCLLLPVYCKASSARHAI
jgi:MFS family permease